MSKRVLIVTASLRPNSNSDALAAAFAEGARTAGHTVESVSLKGKAIGFCTGCMACQKTERCVIRDDAAALAEKVGAADVVVFATPVYYYGLSGQLKTLLDRCNPLFPADYRFREVYLLATAADAEDLLKIALIGRPNVGKSSLFNSLGQKQQALVSSRQGTTRDVNRVRVKYHGRTLEILDTAGLRRAGKREVGIEKFSALRTLAAIEEADVCALLVDATEPHAKLDQTLAGQIINAGKGIIVVLTKSDLVTDTDRILDRLEQDFNFLPYAPVLITSSATGQNVTKLFELATEIDATRHLEIKTFDLNKILGEALLEHPPAGLKNTRPKLKYIVQTDTCPPWFVVHGRDLGLLHWSYKRFLERKIREHYPFIGTPICFSFRSNDRE